LYSKKNRHQFLKSLQTNFENFDIKEKQKFIVLNIPTKLSPDVLKIIYEHAFESENSMKK
jgi:hypothetical protein